MVKKVAKDRFWIGRVGFGVAVQVRTGKVLRVLIRPGWVGRGKAVQVRIVMEWFGRVGTGSAVEVCWGDVWRGAARCGRIRLSRLGTLR